MTAAKLRADLLTPMASTKEEEKGGRSGLNTTLESMEEPALSPLCWSSFFWLAQTHAWGFYNGFPLWFGIVHYFSKEREVWD